MRPLLPTTKFTADWVQWGAGQSWVTSKRAHDWGAWFLNTIRARHGVSGFVANRPSYYAQDYGGTSVLKRNQPYAGGSWYDEDTGTAGNLLTAAIAVLNAQAAAPLGGGIDFKVAEGDSVSAGWSTPGSAAKFIEGYLFIYDALQAAAAAKAGGGAVKSDFPLWLTMIGRRVGGVSYPGQIHEVRMAQLDLLDMLVNGQPIRKALEVYDLELIGGGDSHLTESAFVQAGLREADAVLGALAPGYTPTLGPYVSSVNQLSSTKIRVNVTLEAGYTIRKPVMPAGFRVQTPAGVNIPIISFDPWSGNSISINLGAAQTTPPQFIPVYDACKRFDGTDGLPDDFIKYATTTTYRAAHPLRSSRPITAIPV